jgi:deazaflavin-dependent oxidoreductase (nitroreductase family)
MSVRAVLFDFPWPPAACSASTRSRSVGDVSNTERIKPPWWLKYVNKAMIGLNRLGVGFGGKGPVMLTVAGRKSGKPRSTPVTPMTVDGKRYIVGGLPGSDWAANARAAGEAMLRIGRQTERVRLAEMSADEARPLLREFPIKVPTGVGFIKNAGLVTGANPDEFEALAGRCPVFRVDPVNA